MKRQYLMLAKTYTESLQDSVKGWLMSEKLDGQRALWDGGCSCGLQKKDIPWANLGDNRRNNDNCTGLWSRLGNIIHAPDYFIQHLPKGIPLDGELTGRYRTDLSRQDLRSITSRHKPITVGWEKVYYHIFDIPNSSFIDPGIIDIPHCHIIITAFQSVKWREHFKYHLTAKEAHDKLIKMCLPSFVKVMTQEPLINPEALETFLHNTVTMGGEGLMLRNPRLVWSPYRTKTLLKVKSVKVGTGTVVGYRAGKGKLLGMMGSMLVAWAGKQFEISGFTNDERIHIKITTHVDTFHRASFWCKYNEGKVFPEFLEVTKFLRGSKINFKYASLSDDGIPIEARYLRK